MSSFEEERLRILARVSAGELTQREGSLEIAMAKVRLGEGDGPAEEPEAEGPRARQTLPPLPQAPSRLAIFMFLAIPFLMLAGLMSVGLAFFLALPAYVFMAFWNGWIVPSAPGTVEIGFFPTLGVLVFTTMVSTALRWRRQVKVFMGGQATPGVPFGFQARWPGDGDDGPVGRGRGSLGSGDAFRE